MTSQLARLYALVAAVVVFFVAWAAVAAHPWKPKPAQDPRVAAIAARELRLQRESLQVKALVDRRFAAYRTALAARQHAIASVRAKQAAAAAQVAATPVAATSVAAPAPSVRVVNLPPLVVTRTS